MRPPACVLGLFALALVACASESATPRTASNNLGCERRDPGTMMCLAKDVQARPIATTGTEIPPSDKEARKVANERDHTSPAARVAPPPRDFPPPRPYRPPPPPRK